MKRLIKGAVADKVNASILASAMLVSTSLPVNASDSFTNLVQGANVKTLAPLPPNGTANSAQQLADASKQSLKFTPAVTSNNVGDSAPASDDSKSAAGNNVAASKDTTPDPVAATGGDTATTSNADVKKDTVAAAPADTTDPQPAASDSTTDNSGKEVAQAPFANMPGPKHPQDTYMTRLPVPTGGAVLRRGFRYFSSNAIIHSMQFRDTPAKEVIADIAHRGNLNVILDKTCVGSITGDLHDLTLNEAMDSVLTSAGLEARQLDSSTVIIGLPNALLQMGLNRPLMRVFKVNYASAFDVAQMLWATCFNRGYLTDFTSTARDRDVNLSKSSPVDKTLNENIRTATSPTSGGGTQLSKTTDYGLQQTNGNIEREAGQENQYSTKTDQARTLRGSVREQIVEGTGFNAGSTDPGSQTVRAQTEIVTDFSVDQNGGRAIAIPDVKNRQVVVCGTQDEINIAEECIHLVDRRPKQIHIQSSLVEINNAGIRQLGATLNLQGGGASSTILGGAGVPLINFLPGLGSPGTVLTQSLQNIAKGVTQTVVQNVAGFTPLPLAFNASSPSLIFNESRNSPTGVIGFPQDGFNGNLGNPNIITTPTIANVSANQASTSNFNFLTLSRSAGGRANIATMPAGLNFGLNLILQSNKAKLLANPSVLVNDNTESLITLANEVVHKVTTTVSLGVVSTNVELVKAGIFLNVIPRVSDDGFVTMRLRPQVSSPIGGPQQFANGAVIVTLLNIRDIMSQEVRIKDGQTLVIGGLFTEQEAAQLSKVPYLAEAPILGALFRNTLKGRNRTELMLMITPKVVEDTPPNAVSESPTPTSL